MTEVNAVLVQVAQGVLHAADYATTGLRPPGG